MYTEDKYIVNYQNKNFIMNKFKITDFVLSQWLIVDVDYALCSLHSVCEQIAVVFEVHAASFFMVKV